LNVTNDRKYLSREILSRKLFKINKGKFMIISLSSEKEKQGTLSSVLKTSFDICC
jgi:hypothetical protein